MSESAFGVEHGEVSKAIFTGPGRKKQQQAQQAKRAAQNARIRNTWNNGRGRLRGIPDKIVNTKVSINDVGSTAAKGVSGVGRAATRHPGVVGTAVLAGGGYAAYRGMQNPDLPARKKSEKM